MARRHVWQVTVVLLVVLGGVLWHVYGNAPSSGNASSSPPELVLFVDGTPVYGEEGSSCWSDRIQSQCIDRIGPAALVSDTSATSVSSDASYEIRAPEAPSPDSVHYAVHRPNNSLISTGDTAQFSLPDTPPGTYIVTGGANWEQGDVSYAFKIQITD